jgi:16S rRNA G966 N2-methylase RsmD
MKPTKYIFFALFLIDGKKHHVVTTLQEYRNHRPTADDLNEALFDWVAGLRRNNKEWELINFDIKGIK